MLKLSRPLNYYNSENWPPIGLPNKIKVFKTEAENSNSNEYLTACDYILSSIELESNNTQYIVYPNPVSTHINIKTENISNNVKIFNLLGNLIFESIYYDIEFSIDVNDFSKGLYLIDINGKVEKVKVQ